MRQLGGVAKRVADLGQSTLAVVAVGGDVIDIGPGSIGRFDQAKVVVGVTPAALSSLPSCSQAGSQRNSQQACAVQGFH